MMSNLCRKTSKNDTVIFKDWQHLHIFTLESLINVFEPVSVCQQGNLLIRGCCRFPGIHTSSAVCHTYWSTYNWYLYWGQWLNWWTGMRMCWQTSMMLLGLRVSHAVQIVKLWTKLWLFLPRFSPAAFWDLNLSDLLLSQSEGNFSQVLCMLKACSVSWLLALSLTCISSDFHLILPQLKESPSSRAVILHTNSCLSKANESPPPWPVCQKPSSSSLS